MSKLKDLEIDILFLLEMKDDLRRKMKMDTVSYQQIRKETLAKRGSKTVNWLCEIYFRMMKWM